MVNTLIHDRTLTNDHNASNEAEAKLARFRFLKNNGLISSNAEPGILLLSDNKLNYFIHQPC